MAARKGLLQTPVYELAIYQQFVRAFRERFTTLGRRALITMVVLGVLAIDTRRNQTFLLFAIAAGLMVAAMIVVRIGRPRARLRVSLPERATVGEDVAVSGRVVVDDGDGALLRVVFAERQDARRIAVSPAEQIVAGDAEIRFVLSPKKRGRYVLGELTLRPLDPLGLIAGDAIDAARGAHVLLVAPPIFRFELWSGAIGRRLHPGGIPLASSTSDSLELVGTREWRPGDRLRNVHWRSFARRGVPIVKEFQEEYFPRVAIVLDTHLHEQASEGDRAAFEAMLSVAGSIAAALARADHVVELLAAGPELYRVAMGRGVGHLENVLDVLACIEPCHDAPFKDILPAVEAEILQLGTVIVVLLDWDDPRAALVERVRSLGAEVHVVLVREGAPANALEDDAIERMPPSAVAAALRDRGLA